MWISRKKFEELENRVEKLERQPKLVMSDYNGEFYVAKYTYTHDVSAQVLCAIANHLKVEWEPAKSEKFVVK